MLPVGFRKQIANDRGLGPVNLVAWVAGQVGTVTAVTGFDKANVGIAADFGSSLWLQADKGVILSMENQGGNRYAVDDAGAGGAIVVVVG